LRVEKASLWNTTESDVKSRTSDCSTLWKWDLKSGQFARTYRSYKHCFRHFIAFMVSKPVLQCSDKANFSFSIHLLGFDAIYQGWPATGISGAAL